MKSAFLSLMMVPAIAIFAQPVNGNAAGDPIATVQSGAWSDASTWDCTCVPSPSSDVTVLGGHTVTLAPGDTARAESLSMLAGSVLALPEEARIELAASLASLGEIEGTGVVAFVGEGITSCGPVKLAHLACGSAEVNFSDTVTVTRQLDLDDAVVETGGMLVLQGKSGITTGTGTINGQVHRRYTWDKTNSFNYLAGSGLSGTLAGDFLDLPGAVYVKGWLEPSTAYFDMLPAEEMSIGQGFSCYLPSGLYDYDITGSPNLEADVPVTAEGSVPLWQGWSLLSNPLTAFVDLNQTMLNAGSMGAVYQWVDSLQTYAAHVGGMGQFGMSGVVEPGAAFWTVVDTSGVWSVPTDAIVGRDVFDNQQEGQSNSSLVLQVNSEERVEQCVIGLGSGNAEYNASEDAKFTSVFSGRNNLDIFSKSSDGISLMINKTASEGQIIPIWIKALNGDSVSIQPKALPEGICLQLEDVLTGWVGDLTTGESYSFEVNSSADEHRFNLIVGGAIEATSTEASCASSLDGSIAVIGPSLGSTFSLLDEFGNAAGIFTANSVGGVFSEIAAGTYTVSATSDGCADISKEVEVVAGESGFASFDIQAMPDHIGCYDDHGGVSLDIEGGLAPYTVTWSHGETGAAIEVASAGVLDAVITDAAGCSDSASVEVLAAPQVEAGIAVDEAVVTLIDGEAEVYFENASSGATAYQWNFGDGDASAAENPIHAYTAAGSYTVGLNAWNDYCSDTYQMVVTVETVSSVGDFSGSVEAAIERTALGWQVRHPQEAFNVEVFDLTGRIVHMASGMPGSPVVLDPEVMPAVALVLWKGAQSGQQQTWRLAR